MLDDPAVASYINVNPMFIATVFELFIVATITTTLRRGGRTAKAASPRLYVMGMFAGVLVVVALTAPALAFTGATVDPNSAHFFIAPEHSGH